MTTTTVVDQHGADGFVLAALSSTSQPVAADTPSGDRYRDEHTPIRVDRP